MRRSVFFIKVKGSGDTRLGGVVSMKNTVSVKWETFNSTQVPMKINLF